MEIKMGSGRYRNTIDEVAGKLATHWRVWQAAMWQAAVWQGTLKSVKSSDLCQALWGGSEAERGT